MKLEDTSPSLQQLGQKLFDEVQSIGGSQPSWEPASGWYKATSPRGCFLYIMFLGDKARKNPQQSALLVTKWDDAFSPKGAVQGNHWFGQPSADIVINSDVPDEALRAVAFIQHAFQRQS